MSRPERRIRSQHGRIEDGDLIADWIASVVSQIENSKGVARATSFLVASRKGRPTTTVSREKRTSSGLLSAQSSKNCNILVRKRTTSWVDFSRGVTPPGVEEPRAIELSMAEFSLIDRAGVRMLADCELIPFSGSGEPSAPNMGSWRIIKYWRGSVMIYAKRVLRKFIITSTCQRLLS